MDANIHSDDQNRSQSHSTQRPLVAYRFTNDELRVIRQCNRESFYFRSLPFSTILSIGTYYAVKTGYWKSHPRYGPTPKVLIAATVGFFMGKFSYKEKCAEKLMQLPNSPLADMLRKRQGGFQESLVDPSSMDLSSETPLDTDVNRSIYDGLDDFSRPSVDSLLLEDESLPPPSSQRNVSYEDLRTKNREEYEGRKSSGLHRPVGTTEPSVPPPRASSGSDYRPWPKPKNKYGDIWEE